MHEGMVARATDTEVLKLYLWFRLQSGKALLSRPLSRSQKLLLARYRDPQNPCGHQTSGQDVRAETLVR